MGCGTSHHVVTSTTQHCDAVVPQESPAPHAKDETVDQQELHHQVRQQPEEPEVLYFLHFGCPMGIAISAALEEKRIPRSEHNLTYGGAPSWLITAPQGMSVIAHKGSVISEMSSVLAYIDKIKQPLHQHHHYDDERKDGNAKPSQPIISSSGQEGSIVLFPSNPVARAKMRIVMQELLNLHSLLVQHLLSPHIESAQFLKRTVPSILQNLEHIASQSASGLYFLGNEPCAVDFLLTAVIYFVVRYLVDLLPMQLFQLGAGQEELYPRLRCVCEATAARPSMQRFAHECSQPAVLSYLWQFCPIVEGSSIFVACCVNNILTNSSYIMGNVVLGARYLSEQQEAEEVGGSIEEYKLRSAQEEELHHHFFTPPSSLVRLAAAAVEEAASPAEVKDSASPQVAMEECFYDCVAKDSQTCSSLGPGQYPSHSSGSDMHSRPSSNSTSSIMHRRFSIQRKAKIGQGSFSDVYKAFDVERGVYCAVKESRLAGAGGCSDSKEMREQWLREFGLLKGLSHPNVVEALMLEIGATTSRIYMEWMPMGSLGTLVRQNGPLSENVVRQHFKHLLSALAYIHEKGIIHRDIKPGNLLLTSSGVVKLSDFGMTLQAGLDTVHLSQVCGTLAYMSKDALEGKYSGASDMWALALSMNELLTGKEPWSAKQDRKSTAEVMKQIVSATPPNHHPPLANGISAELRSVLEQCLHFERRQRPRAAQLLENPYFAK